MHGMALTAPGTELQWLPLDLPDPTAHEVLIEVEACAVCRTDLHVLDGELPDIPYPIVPGHQVVGKIVAAGAEAELAVGTHVGVAWLASTCQRCDYCRSGRENLCDQAQFNGYNRNGGYADHMLADSRFIFPLPDTAVAATFAPLLCGGLIGYRSLCKTGEANKLGIYGFGSAAHLITQLAVSQGREVYAFVRPGDQQAIRLALDCGACWAGSSLEPAPHLLDAGIIFAPAGELVPKALTDLRKGGVVVCGGIHMSDIPSFPYADLWGERRIESVANMTRADGQHFMRAAEKSHIQPQVECWPLQQANEVLELQRNGRISGTAVLIPS